MATAWRSKWLDWKPGDEIISVFPQTELTKLTKPTSVSFVSAASGVTKIISAPTDHPDAWREPFSRWLDSACVRSTRCFGGASCLHIAFCEWEVQRGRVPSTRDTFERLLTERGFLIGEVAGVVLVSGLTFREDFEVYL